MSLAFNRAKAPAAPQEHEPARHLHPVLRPEVFGLGLNELFPQNGLFESPESLNQNIKAYDEHVSKLLRLDGDALGEATQQILIKHTDGQMRDDGVTPARRHQYDQFMYGIAFRADRLTIMNQANISRLTLGHDLLEDIFPGKQELRKEYDELLSPSKGSTMDADINKLIRKIDLMSKSYKGGKPKFDTQMEFLERMMTDPDTALARMFDHTNNTHTELRVWKEVAIQAERVDRTAIMFVGENYRMANGKLYSYTQICSNRFQSQKKTFEVALEMLRDIVNEKRCYHDVYPESQVPRKRTGVRLHHPKEVQPRPGFRLLPYSIHPLHVLYQDMLLLLAEKGLTEKTVNEMIEPGVQHTLPPEELQGP